eukprot:350462_1
MIEVLRYRNPGWLLPELIIAAIEISICLCCFIYSIYVYRTSRGAQQLSLSISLKLLNLFGISSFLLCSVTQSINAYYYNTFWWEFTMVQTSTWYLTWFFWSCGQFISYLLFLDRIKTSFEKSSYAITQLTKICSYILLLIYQILWTISNFVPFMLFIPNEPISRTNIYKIEFYMTIPTTFIDVIITFSMTYMFVSRLYKLILLQTTIDYNEQKEISNSCSVSIEKPILLKQRHKKMIKVSVKITALTVTSLISSLILITFRAVSNFHQWKDTSFLDKVCVFWLQIDTSISSLCLVLFLPKTEKGFKMLCCCCRYILSKCMKSAVRKSTIQLSDKMENQKSQYIPAQL